MRRIAFLGLGNMGGPMAANLLKAGFEVSVFDIQEAARERFRELGAKVSSTAEGTLHNAECVISMLPSSPHVESLYLGSDGLLKKLDPKVLVIDCSTIAPQSARKVAAEAASLGITMIDAPVSGGTAGATQGTLTFIVGGPSAALEKARPLLQAMGKNIFHAGDSGAGQVAKICNNMLLAIHMAGTAEALNLGVANGLDPKVLSEVMAKSSGRNWSLEVYNPWPGVQENVPSSRGYSGGFGSKLMLKDLGLAREASQSSGASIPLGQKAFELYAKHCETDGAALDFSGILQSFRDGLLK
ncbi:MAG: 3-hydroxyisobutyrate dehydrogenase [Bdellovibrionota bacterium]